MKFLRALTVAALFAALFILATPVQADCGDGDPNCLLEPPVSREIRTVSTNGNASITAAESGALGPLDFAVTMPLPRRVEAPSVSAYLEPESTDSIPDFTTLSIPMRYQAAGDTSCGVQALGMALDGIKGSAPTSSSVLGFLQDQGMMYDFGTGVEELAHAAQNFGYAGSLPFHRWSLDQLIATLAEGKPVVVALGANGEGEPGHFVTVTGVSPDGKWVSFNDPTLGRRVISAVEFERLWRLQGSSGVTVAEAVPAGAPADHAPLVALAAGLMALVSTTPMALQRKGIGGALIHHDGGAGGSSSAPPYTAPAGYKWKKNIVTKYGYKDVSVTEKVEMPNIVRKWAIVKVNRWIEKVPIYKTVKVDRGHWAYRSVIRYRTERYRTKERYRVRKTYWYRRNGRFYRGTSYEWKTRTVVKIRKVPYRARERYWVRRIVEEKRFVRNREIEHRDPVYGWRNEKQGTKIVEVTKTIPGWMPVGTQVKWELERLTTSSPMHSPDTTPIPSSTPEPERLPTPDVTGTPFPVSDQDPFAYIPDETTSFLANIVKWAKKGKSIWGAAGLVYNELPSGYYSVSAPLKEAGTKLGFRLKQFIPGTRYTSRGLATASGRSLLKKWANGLKFSVGIPVAVNLIDYSIGEHSDAGIKSNEFAASTAVDVAQSGLTGLAAAGLVAGGVALIGGALSVAAVASAPLWVLAGVTALVGVGISAAVEHFIDTDKLKQDVTEGFSTFPGIIDNAKTIADVGADRVGQVVKGFTQNTGEAIGNAVADATDTIIDVTQTITKAVSNIVQNVADAITGFVGSLFGGGD